MERWETVPWYQLGRAEVLWGLGNFLNTDRPEHHNIDRLKERGVEKGSSRHSTLQGRERSVFTQANIGTVSTATLGRLPRDGAERVWTFPSATMPSWAETETGASVRVTVLTGRAVKPRDSALRHVPLLVVKPGIHDCVDSWGF